MQGLFRISWAICIPLVMTLVACGPYYGRDGYGYGYSQHVSAYEVEEAIARNPHVSARDIRVSTDGSVVILSGFVESEHQREEAVRAAYAVRGVSRVYADDLRIDRYSYAH